MDTLALAVAIVLGLHVVLKFAVFLLPYRRRRTALDRQYAGRTTATAISDTVSLVVVVAVAAVLFLAGVDAVSFLVGLWIGATLIQLYFHRFHERLTPATEPAAPTSPIKTMSYAIQARPWLPWREMTVLIALVAAGLAQLALAG